MKRLLIIGCGDVGLRVAKLLQLRYRIYALTHSVQRLTALREQGLLPLAGDLDSPETLSGLSGLAHDVIHLAPPPPQSVQAQFLDPAASPVQPRFQPTDDAEFLL